MTARQIIYSHIQAHSHDTGFQMPETLAWYITDMITERLTEGFWPKLGTFAEQYLSLYNSKDISEIRHFADDSLVFCSVCPDYGRRRGLSMDYYASLGISAYYSYADLVEDDRYTQLGNWFYDLQRFLHTALTQQGFQQGYPDFCSRWMPTASR